MTSELARLRAIRIQASRDLVGIVRKREQERINALAVAPGTETLITDCPRCGRPLLGKRLHEHNTDRLCTTCRPRRVQNAERAEESE